MANKTKKRRGLLAALGLVVPMLFVPGHALADGLPPCTPVSQSYSSDAAMNAAAAAWAQKICDAENRVYSTWDPKLTALDVARQELSTATQAGHWNAYREKWAAAFPLIQELQAAALANREVSGAANLLSRYGPELQFLLQNAGLGTSSELNDTAAKIIAGLHGTNASAAATAGIILVQQSVTRGREFLHGLSLVAKAEVQQAHSAELKAQAQDLRDKREGRTIEAYVGGFGERIGSVWAGFLTLFVVVVVGAGWRATKQRQNALVAGVAAGIAYVLPGMAFTLAMVFLPFLPEWLTVAATLVGTVAIYFFGSRVFNALAAPLGQSFLARRLRFVGRVLDNLRHGLRGTAPVSTSNAVANMTADTITHGSARWGTVAQMAAMGHLAPRIQRPTGFVLGRADTVPAGLDPRFRFVGHVVTVAPTGAGKGIGAVIPNLLEYPGSALVLDIKGENTAITARARRQLGQRVFVVDPFNVTQGETHAFNWLDRLNISDPECVSESAMLADSLVMVDPKGGDEHFDESAKTLLQGLMLHVANLDDTTKRHLGELRRLLTAHETALLATLSEMATQEDIAFGLPARSANTIMGMADRERGSVLSTARRHTAFLDDPRITAALSCSDFDLARIKSEPMTVYLVLPANKISANARFIRGFIGAVIAALTSSPTPPVHRVAFFLDEFGQLGYMKSIEDAMSLMRGYGLSFWIFIQDLSQLKGVYPKWQTFLANAVKTFYGTDDYDTAKYVSDSLGQATIEYETHNEGKNQGLGVSGGGGSLNRGKSAGTSQQLTGRHLLTPDEVMRLGPERPIVLVKGEFPYQLTRLNYLTDAEYEGKADPNPYHR